MLVIFTNLKKLSSIKRNCIRKKNIVRISAKIYRSDIQSSTILIPQSCPFYNILYCSIFCDPYNRCLWN